MRDFLLKFGVIVAALLSLTWLPYIVIGFWNRLFGGWTSVFFCYAGSPAYLRRYAPRPVIPFFRWRPSPIGILKQGKGLGLVFAAPMTEEDFLDPANATAFARFQRRLDRIAKLAGIGRINLAGILPGVLQDGTILPVADTRITVATAVCQATGKLVQDRFRGLWPEIIVLGGSGHVGTEVTRRLRADGRVCHVVDPAAGRSDLPDLSDRPALLIDLARKGALEAHLDTLWPGLVILNETFPEPHRELRRALCQRGIDLYHLSGVAGRIWPNLPFGYAHAVPCCAVHDTGSPLEVRIVRLASGPDKRDGAPQPDASRKPVSAA